MEDESHRERDDNIDIESSPVVMTDLAQRNPSTNDQNPRRRQSSTGAIPSNIEPSRSRPPASNHHARRRHLSTRNSIANVPISRLDGQFDFLEDSPLASFREFSLSKTNGPTRHSSLQLNNIGPSQVHPHLEPPSQYTLPAASTNVSRLSSDQEKLPREQSESPENNIPDYFLRNPYRVTRSSSGEAAAIELPIIGNRRGSYDIARPSLERVVHNPTPPLSHIGLQRPRSGGREGNDIRVLRPRHHSTSSIESLERDIRNLQAEVHLLRSEKASQNTSGSNSPRLNHGGPGPSNLRYSISVDSRDGQTELHSSLPVRSRSKLQKINRSQSLDPSQGRLSNRNSELLRTSSNRSSSSGSSRGLRKRATTTYREIRDADAATVSTSRWSLDSTPPRKSMIRRAGHKLKKRIRQKMFAMIGAQKGLKKEGSERTNSIDGSVEERPNTRASTASPSILTTHTVAYVDTRSPPREERSQSRSTRRRLRDRPSMRWLRRHRPLTPHQPLSMPLSG